MKVCALNNIPKPFAMKKVAPKMLVVIKLQLFPKYHCSHDFFIDIQLNNEIIVPCLLLWIVYAERFKRHQVSEMCA